MEKRLLFNGIHRQSRELAVGEADKAAFLILLSTTESPLAGGNNAHTGADGTSDGPVLEGLVESRLLLHLNQDRKRKPMIKGFPY